MRDTWEGNFRKFGRIYKMKTVSFIAAFALKIQNLQCDRKNRGEKKSWFWVKSP